jgi:hypothetical protein
MPPALGSWIGPVLLAIALLVAITSCPALSGARRRRATAPASTLALGRRSAAQPPAAGAATSLAPRVVRVPS